MPKSSKSSTTQTVLKSSFYNFWCTLVSKIGGLIFTIIVARLLFPELFGIYSLALTVVLTIATFTDLGINSTLIRYLAESLKKKTPPAKTEARSRLYFLLNFKIALTIVASLLLFTLANVLAIYVFKKPTLTLPLQLGSIYLFAISLQSFFSSAFYALQKINYSAIAELIFQIARIAFVFILFMFYKTVANVFIALIIAFFISFLFLWLIILRKYPFLLKGKKLGLEKQERKKLLTFFGWLTISNISLIFFVHIDTFMLGIFLPAQFIGFYHAAFSIVGTVAAFVAFGSVLLPIFTQIEAGKLERGFKKVLRYTSLAAIPASIGLAFIIVPVIQIIYGSAYVPSSYRLAIIVTSALLSLVIIETTFTTTFSALFQAKEQPKIPAILIVIATIANIILNYAFIKIGISIAPQYGLVGVAAATLITRYGNMVALGVLVKKKLNMKAETASIIKPLIASVIMLVFLFVFNYFVAMSIFIGILMIIAGVLIYIIIMFLIKGINKEDFKMIKMLK